MPDKIKSEVSANLDSSETPCLRLRCKEMFIDFGDGEIFNLKDSGSGIYWCSHTQNCLGPDGRTVHVSHCTQGRGCYEAS